MLNPPTQIDRRGLTPKVNLDGTYATEYPNGDKPEGGEISISGTIAHGETITITDSLSRLGSRANEKPLYVNLGDQKAGSSLGRDIGDYFDGSADIVQTPVNGGLTGGVRFDFKTTFQPSFEGLNFDQAKPVIEYLERYYDFDTTQAQYQNSSGEFNLKTNRHISDGQSNLYIGYQGGEGGNCRAAVEFVSGNVSKFYSAGGPPGFEWLSEEIVFKNATAEGVEDGECRHYRNNEFLNGASGKYLFPTFDSSRPEKPDMLRLDQVSNGCGSGVTNVYGYFGYMCIDDEFPGVYVGNAQNRESCTRLVRQPQKTWTSSQATIQIVESAVILSGAWLHVRTGQDSWLDGVQI